MMHTEAPDDIPIPGIFKHAIKVTKEVIDLYGHVNNISYLHWMIDVTIRHSNARGWPMARYFKAGIGWVVRSHYIEYLKPAFENEEITAVTWVSEMRHRSSRRRYVFIREKDKVLLAQAETRWVLVEHKTGRACRIPDELKSTFDIVEDDRKVSGIWNWPQRCRGRKGARHE